MSSAMSISYWSPVEKLILHLSPVSRRRAAKNQNGPTTTVTTSNPRNRSRSEPNGRRRSRILYSSSTSTTTPPSITSKTSLVNDVKTLRWFCINEVGRKDWQSFGGLVVAQSPAVLKVVGSYPVPGSFLKQAYFSHIECCFWNVNVDLRDDRCIQSGE